MTYEVPLTRREAVLDQLRVEIRSGVLGPGDSIKDAELARRLGVSVTPVREAITQLISEGLIESTPNKRRRVAVMTDRKAHELMDLMGVLTVAALRRAAPRLSPNDLQLLREATDRYALEAGSRNRGKTKDVMDTITRVFYEAAGNTELTAAAERVMAQAYQLIELTSSSRLWDLWTQGWCNVVELLERGDGDGAADRLQAVFDKAVDLTSDPSDTVIRRSASTSRRLV